MTNASDIDRELCTLCPRNCRVRREAGEYGYCRTGREYNIASIFMHRGEEPPVSGEAGICNVFFTHCNLQCVFCQNYQISQNKIEHPEYLTRLPEVVRQIEKLLDRGATGVGFVSPSHCIPQMRKIIRALRGRGRSPFFVMNTNGYDRKETIESLKEEIDLYLPDLKYMDSELAERYSGAPDYPEIAAEALKEMFRQKGSRLTTGRDGLSRPGLIIRHLILPGQVENSKACLRFIAEELSVEVHISLLAQYHPIPRVRDHPTLGRTLHREEYEEVREEMVRLGFQRGWVQELESHDSYLPDFNQANVFVGTGNGGVDEVN
ncbi:MAG: radical SAM protein [Candidatus Euphemobacter frigidus]|nr:radical SAM protein [Candidatus Euphemobacter frigidus]MDP8275971.1 radical SAM protein [Candidatus Euphemobacter frigidus]